MAVQIFKEPFSGKYDGVSPSTLLPPGWVSGGENVRKVSRTGGWKPRRGMTLYNTTAMESGATVRSLHDYTHPRNADNHFIAQINSLLYASSYQPPATSTTFGSSLGVAVGDTPGFSCMVEEDWLYADGSARPIIYGGDDPYCLGFLVYDNSEASFVQNPYVDYSRWVTDDTTKAASLGTGSSDVFYICSNEIAHSAKVDMKTANVNTATMAIYSWVDGAWDLRVAGTDGTLAGGNTLAQDGTIAWTRNPGDEMRILGGIMGYWYKFVPSATIYASLATANISNGDIDDDPCTYIPGWTDLDLGTGASTPVTYDEKTTFKFDSGGTAGSGHYARRDRDVGTIGSTYAFSISLYHAALGTTGNNDPFFFIVYNGDISLSVRFATDGLFVFDGVSYNEVGSDLVSVDTWQTWTFEVDSSTPASATCTVYLDGVSQASGVDCSTVTAASDGLVQLQQKGNTTVNRITYVDFVKVGSVVATIYDPVEIQTAQVVRSATKMTNKWNGAYEYLAGARFLDVSTGEYVDILGELSSELQIDYYDIGSGATGDFLYLKATEPMAAIGLGIVAGKTNVATSQKIDNIEYWEGNSWATVSGIIDDTIDVADNSSFSQTGVITWDASQDTPKRRTIPGDSVPGYWYRVSWSGTLAAAVHLFFAVYAPKPDELSAYDGCFESRGRLLLWGDSEFPNRLRYSAYRRPDCFSGSDSGYSKAFGGRDKILCALDFGGQIVVWKKDAVYAERAGKIEKIANVGLASPQTVDVVEVGSPGMHKDEVMPIVLWQNVDGVYAYDGRKTRKVSDPIGNYFNPESATCIAAASIRNRASFADFINDEYHLLLPTSELVYNVASDEWYPPWEREVDLTCGLSVHGSDNREYTYGGTAVGVVYRLENDTADRNATNVEVAIAHSIKTRSIAADQIHSTSLEFTLRKLWADFKAQAAGTPTTEIFKNGASSGTTEAVPGTMSMISSGNELVVDGLDLSTEACFCFQVKFSLDEIDQEMEIYSVVFELEVRGEIAK